MTTTGANEAGRLCRLMVSALPLLGACGDGIVTPPTHEFAGSIMGTSYSVQVIDPPSGFDDSVVRNSVDTLLATLNSALSTYDPKSELSMFNASRSTDWVGVSALLCDVVAGALEVSRLTDGAFDITVGPLVNLWGFGPGVQLVEPPSDALVAETLRHIGYRRLEADCNAPALKKSYPDLYVDLSAYAKGDAVDRVAALLDQSGLPNYLIDIGGELRVRGHNVRGEAWRIAIEKPVASTRTVQTIVRLSDTGLATSGDYRNFFEHEGVRYSHTIDPRSGRPVEHDAASVTVIAERAARADALATALLVLGPDTGLTFAEQEGIAALFLLRSGDGIEERASSRFVEEGKP